MDQTFRPIDDSGRRIDAVSESARRPHSVYKLRMWKPPSQSITVPAQ